MIEFSPNTGNSTSEKFLLPYAFLLKLISLAKNFCLCAVWNNIYGPWPFQQKKNLLQCVCMKNKACHGQVQMWQLFLSWGMMIWSKLGTNMDYLAYDTRHTLFWAQGVFTQCRYSSPLTLIAKSQLREVWTLWSLTFPLIESTSSLKWLDYSDLITISPASKSRKFSLQTKPVECSVLALTLSRHGAVSDSFGFCVPQFSRV